MDTKVSRFRSIKSKVLLLTIGVLIVSGTLISYILLEQYYRVFNENIESNVSYRADFLVGKIDNEFSNVATNLKLLVSTSAFLSMNYREIENEFKKYNVQNVFFPDERLSVVDAKGYEIANNQRLSTRVKKPVQIPAQKVDRTETVFSGDLEWIKNVPYLAMTTFIDGFERDGFLIAHISYTRIWKVVESFRFGKTGSAYVVHRDGTLLAHSDRNLVRNRVDMSDLLPVENLKNGESGQGKYVGKSGEVYLGIYKYIPKLSIGIVVQQSIEEVKEEIIATIINLVIVLIGVVLITSAFVLILTRKLVIPIQTLTDKSLVIASGNLHEPIQVVDSQDEIGVLSKNFEMMRYELQQYTVNLESLVEEKVYQIKEIMDNIQQALFTVNLDGTINEDYSKQTLNILRLEIQDFKTIKNAFRLNDEEMAVMQDWLELVQIKHNKMRWKKLVKLAPSQSLVIEEDGQKYYFKIEFQKLHREDTDESVRIMVLATDITGEVASKLKYEKQRARQENEAKTILAVVKNPREIVLEFMEDTKRRYQFVRDNFDAFLKKKHEADTIQACMNELHTIKGNSGALGFSEMEMSSHQLEEHCIELQGGEYNMARWQFQYFQKMEVFEQVLEHIEKLYNDYYGADSNEFVWVKKSKVDRILSLTSNSDNLSDVQIKGIIAECQKIDHQDIKKLTRKYEDLAIRVAEKKNIEIEFDLESNLDEVPADTFLKYDEVLIHMLRNAVDHGYTRGSKEALHITLGYELTIDEERFYVKDNGRGIDRELLLNKALENKLIKDSVAEKLTDQEKLELIFIPGLSSKSMADTVSGRGFGMDIIKKQVETLKGSLEVESQLGKGTCFTISIKKKTQQLNPVN